MSMTFLIGAAVLIGLFIFLKRGGISGPEARKIVEGGGTLVDVRSPSEFASGHLPGARNIPVDELDKRVDELGAKETPVVVYCRSGARSAQAASILARAGFTSVSNLGAMSRW
ncbi:MAG: rhodanese-like domain-containing protein [Deltaproteobacteria bacterium]|nr:rhodanese-like domain-containing protein [Deltaproteobacteria bacterium]